MANNYLVTDLRWGGMFMDISIFDTLEQEIHTIPQLLYNNREHAGEQMANLFQEDGTVYKISYDEMLQRVECIAIGLLKLNIMKGDRIAFIGTPSARMLWVDLGVMCTGAISIPLQNEEYTVDLRELRAMLTLRRLWWTEPSRLNSSSRYRFPIFSTLSVLNVDIAAMDFIPLVPGNSTIWEKSPMKP